MGSARVCQIGHGRRVTQHLLKGLPAETYL
jgi:hypothetical protein